MPATPNTTVRPALLGFLVALLVTGCTSGAGDGRPSRPDPGGSTTSVTATAPSSASTSPTPTSESTPTRAPKPARAAVVTPEGMWWGVDSYSPISEETLANVRDWYRGSPRPQFWGRYLTGHAAVHRGELAIARRHGIYVLVIVPDQNCSGCSGGDACANDQTAAQARQDAAGALRAARKLHLPTGMVLFKDIEEVSSCHDEPTPAYLYAWYLALRGTAYRTGFYANVHKQFFEFPRSYCRLVKDHRAFADDVVLDMNEDEPLIGAPRGSTGPHNAPKFAPKTPDCAPAGSTVAWQYGESIDDDNLTDIDQARPDVHGLLSPAGTAT